MDQANFSVSGKGDRSSFESELAELRRRFNWVEECRHNAEIEIEKLNKFFSPKPAPPDN